jgi:SAM-dependent methyltransferase
MSPTILDYGCWDGDFIHRVSQMVEGGRAIGCDVDGEAIARAVELHGDAVTFFTVEPGAQPLLPLDDSSVSVAFLCDVLEHLGDGLEAAVVAEIARVLAPGGVLIVTVPHRGVLAWADPENFKFRWPAVHRRIFSWLHGAETYQNRYGDVDGHFGNFSPGARWHRHYSVQELAQLLALQGLRLDAARHHGLLSPIIFTGLSMTERVAGRMGRRMRWMTAPLWFLRRADASLRPGRLSYDVAVRAVKPPFGGFQQHGSDPR